MCDLVRDHPKIWRIFTRPFNFLRAKKIWNSMENTLNIDDINTTTLTKIPVFFYPKKQRIRAYVDSCLCFAVAASLKFNESCVRIRIARRLCGNPALLVLLLPYHIMILFAAICAETQTHITQRLSIYLF